MARQQLRLVPCQDGEALRAAGIFITPGELRAKKCQGWHPGVFIKIVGRVYIDLDAWEREVIAPALAEREMRIARVARIGMLKRIRKQARGRKVA
jgi:hypothetical protein